MANEHQEQNEQMSLNIKQRIGYSISIFLIVVVISLITFLISGVIYGVMNNQFFFYEIVYGGFIGNIIGQIIGFVIIRKIPGFDGNLIMAGIFWSVSVAIVFVIRNLLLADGYDVDREMNILFFLPYLPIVTTIIGHQIKKDIKR